MSDLSPREQVKKRVPTLTQYADQTREIRPAIVNTFGPWSALKLIVLAATVNMYTTIISSYKDDWFYVDALAGSGVSVYGDLDECFHGSPILAARDAAEQFTKMYFIEDDDEKAEALEARLEAVFDSETDIEGNKPMHGFDVFPADANSKLEKIKYDIWDVATRNGKDPSFNTLTFVDNQALDLNWEGMEHIGGNLDGDFLVNFPSGFIVRPANHTESTESMTDFYGSEIWKADRSREGLIEAYKTRLTGLGTPNQVVTNVHSGIKNYQYDMLYATKEDADYVDAIEYVRDFVEAVDGSDVEQLLEIVNGKQDTIESFLPDVPEEEKDQQKKLGEF